MIILDIKKKPNEIISKAITILNQGGIIIYPTETCYGLGVDSTNQKAVDKLISYKTFRNDKPISIAVCNSKMAENYVNLNKTAKNLYKEYLPGPFTIISKSKSKVAIGIESETKTLGIRIPKHDFLLKLIQAFRKPITATSANASYKKTPYSIADILNNTSKKQKDLIDLIIDAGTLPKNLPSTVIDTTLDDVNILRQGDIILKNTCKFVTKSEKETREFGEKIALTLLNKKLEKPIIIALQGELGTGKTQVCKGIGKSLKIKEEIISPTFIVCREYPIKNTTSKLFHIDTYKLSDPNELFETGFREMVLGNNIIVIEWAEKVSKIIKDLGTSVSVIWINMYHKSETERIIEYGVVHENTRN